MAWASKMERLAIGERVASARERIEAEGGRWGRPSRVDRATRERAIDLKAAGKTYRLAPARRARARRPGYARARERYSAESAAAPVEAARTLATSFSVASSKAAGSSVPLATASATSCGRGTCSPRSPARTATRGQKRGSKCDRPWRSRRGCRASRPPRCRAASATRSDSFVRGRARGQRDRSHCCRVGSPGRRGRERARATRRPCIRSPGEDLFRGERRVRSSSTTRRCRPRPVATTHPGLFAARRPPVGPCGAGPVEHEQLVDERDDLSTLRGEGLLDLDELPAHVRPAVREEDPTLSFASRAPRMRRSRRTSACRRRCRGPDR